MYNLEDQIHNCRKCKNINKNVEVPYYPVFSFGDPKGKDLFIIGINPSTKEFERNHLCDSSDVEIRKVNQHTYFDRRSYSYFSKLVPFFKGEVQNKLGWKNNPWEKVGVLDLVKCPTRANDGQWTHLSPEIKSQFIKNCEDFLIEQITLYKSRIIIPYGKDVCIWLYEKYIGKLYYNDLEYSSYVTIINGNKIQIIFIHQRQGHHSKPEIKWVQDVLLKAM